MVNTVNPVGIGIQDFLKLRENHNFYIDKTSFIKEWWESGFGRYDIMLEPVNPDKDDAIIIEFKVFNPKKEKSLEESLASAINQIEKKQYETALISKGIPKEKIRKYGFAFEGKNVLIGGNAG